ncbi:hypothetical protein CDO52_25060 [Nocardiopsis gilva YIM 90087]|uniref:Uncharacterized protein n=1 Tax=Nocardiopsis gilva YIM 90087 TaxID=1235441 RepID=A0A223SBU8_9ACTN|nr:hypothetical protein [Nocardiopsis gilva]ASU85634.1 hypothetical protein CDO52_25060 [Nocardiopsis gilva YIM 90087]
MRRLRARVLLLRLLRLLWLLRAGAALGGRWPGRAGPLRCTFGRGWKRGALCLGRSGRGRGCALRGAPVRLWLWGLLRSRLVLRRPCSGLRLLGRTGRRLHRRLTAGRRVGAGANARRGRLLGAGHGGLLSAGGAAHRGLTVHGALRSRTASVGRGRRGERLLRSGVRLGLLRTGGARRRCSLGSARSRSGTRVSRLRGGRSGVLG